MAGSVPWSDSQQQLQSTMQTLLKPRWKHKNLQQGDHRCCLPGRKGYRRKERGLVSSLLFRKEEPWTHSLEGPCKVEPHGCGKGNLRQFSRKLWTFTKSYIYLKAPSQKRLIRRITKLVEEAAPEHCNAPCCLSLTGAEECRGTLRFRQHCLLFKCCQDNRTLSPAWLPKGK